jgi:transposase
MLKREQLPAEMTALQDLTLSLDQQRELLTIKLEQFKRRYFGPSSEKRHDTATQPTLFEDLPAAPTPSPKQALKQAEVVEKGASKPRAHGRRKLPPELLRERREYEPEEIKQPCPCGCGKPWRRIGEEISEQLERIPETFFVIQHARIKCISGCGKKIVIGKVADKLWDKSLAGPGLIADLIVKKVALHLPHYRNEWLTEQLGFTLARSTQCQWLGAAAELLEPLYLEGKRDVLRSGLIHTDDTPVRVQAKEQTREGRFWVYVGDPLHPFTLFDYTPNRKREGPKNFLGAYQGVLQADAYGGYDGIYTNGKVQEAGCMAHARRKFDEAKGSVPAAADEMLNLIGQLYAVEAQTRPAIAAALLLPLSERAAALREAYRQRLESRQKLSAPMVAQIKSWLAAHKADALPEGPLGKAIHYMENQWAALTFFLSDGAADIDNNVAENALRPLCVGRRNWLFLGNDEGGRRLAILYSLVESCRRNEVNPWDYLKDVLVRISKQPPGTLKELLPHHWKETHPKPSAANSPVTETAAPATAGP